MLKRNSVTAVRGRKLAAEVALATPVRSKPRAPARAKVADKEVRITHPERIVFPGTKYSKQDVADYYRAVMPWMLPELRERPLSLLRLGLLLRLRSLWRLPLLPRLPSFLHRLRIPPPRSPGSRFALPAMRRPGRR